MVAAGGGQHGSSPVTGRESSVTWLLFGGPSGSAVRGARAVVSHGAWCWWFRQQIYACGCWWQWISESKTMNMNWYYFYRFYRGIKNLNAKKILHQMLRTVKNLQFNVKKQTVLDAVVLFIWEINLSQSCLWSIPIHSFVFSIDMIFNSSFLHSLQFQWETIFVPTNNKQLIYVQAKSWTRVLQI